MRIVVDTLLDDATVNAAGGLMSLREAIALAEATTGADEIVFSESLLDSNGTAQISIQADFFLANQVGVVSTSFTGFTVNSADGLTINGDLDGDGTGDLILNGGFGINNDSDPEPDSFRITPHFMIGSSGALTLEAMTLRNGGTVFFDAAADGADQTLSATPPANGTDGEDAVGSILNEGTLTLDRVLITNSIAVAQDGGNGGDAIAALDGLNGVFGGDGRDGDDGDNGGSGGDGGTAAAVINRGDLTFINSGFGSAFEMTGGNGGNGGRGGDAGDGGDGDDGADAVFLGPSAQPGGDGGNSGIRGNGGLGGDGGSAHLYLFNDGGTVSFDAEVAIGDDSFPGSENTATAGGEGSGGSRGSVGSGGQGGNGGQRLVGTFAPDGSNGDFFDRGFNGSPGDPGNNTDPFGGIVDPSTADTLVFVRTDQTSVSEGEDIVFQIGLRTTSTNYNVTVNFEIITGGTSVNADDFTPGTALIGSVIVNGSAGAEVRLSTVLDGALEEDEVVALTINSITPQVGGLDEAITNGTVGVRVDRGRAADLALDNNIQVDDGSATAGLGGNDTITGSSLDDFFLGGADDDSLIGLGGADTLLGEDGDDELFGGDNNDALEGGGGDDTLFGGDGNDSFTDSDTLESAGSDLYDGGAGEADQLFYNKPQSDFAFSIQGTSLIINNTAIGGRDTVEASVEQIVFRNIDGTEDARSFASIFNALQPVEPPAPTGPTNAADVLIGTAGRDAISGFGGNDRIVGLGNADRLFGGVGADTVIGGAGADRMTGGGGNDRLDGGVGNDNINGGVGRDVLIGRGGSDRLKGDGGADRLIGNNGNDRLDGGGGVDRLFGGAGRDEITGGRGSDVLIGGGGADRFVFSRGDGRDTIRDFRQGQDKIKIGTGADNFSDLSISQRGDDVLIRFSNVLIRVEDEDASDFSAGDFLF